MSALAISVAPEEQQRVVEVREVNLDRNVMQPWLYAVGEPVSKMSEIDRRQMSAPVG